MKVAVVIPVYNDLGSLKVLINELKKVLDQNGFRAEIFVVDDASSEELHSDHYEMPLTVISLKRNCGHQQAIAIGLNYCKEHFKGDYIVVMDADGEDDPKYIPEMIEKGNSESSFVFAKRSKRSEGFIFKLFYGIYKIIFILLTGKRISFGNFSAFPISKLDRLLEVEKIQDHYSGAIIRSKLPYTSISSKRSKRYLGKSKMNFTALVLHGFSSLSVYIETVLTRIVLFTSAVFVINCGLALIVLYRKFISGVASPGWATTMIFGLILLSLILMGFSFLTGLIVLNSKNKGMQNELSANYSSMIKEINKTS